MLLQRWYLTWLEPEHASICFCRANLVKLFLKHGRTALWAVSYLSLLLSFGQQASTSSTLLLQSLLRDPRQPEESYSGFPVSCEARHCDTLPYATPSVPAVQFGSPPSHCQTEKQKEVCVPRWPHSFGALGAMATSAAEPLCQPTSTPTTVVHPLTTHSTPATRHLTIHHQDLATCYMVTYYLRMATHYLVYLPPRPDSSLPGDFLPGDSSHQLLPQGSPRPAPVSAEPPLITLRSSTILSPLPLSVSES